MVGYARPAPRPDLAVQARPDLLTLIAEVDTDSLSSYVRQLQAFPGRVNGTQSNRDSRDWIYDKFADFGYDSLFTDPFEVYLSGAWTTCYNVVATKTGATFPNIHVVVGAHFDAVPGSPGADDNGSGTAGVLELARILRDVETELTFVFVAFDAEETGLNGAWHYADRAASQGQQIISMLNMDMIAYLGNTTEAALYFGPDRSYADLWVALADSLLGVTGNLSGASASSDHYPFSQNGYPVVFVAEEEFSSVYHTAHDSTTYMDFNYMTLLVKASLATVFVVGTPQPTLVIGYPSGLPEWVEPFSPTTIQVQVTSAWGGVPVPGSGQLHYSVAGGAYSSLSLIDLGGDLFEATIPPVGCADRILFYVSVDEAEGQTFTDPDPAAANWAPVASQTVLRMHDDFEVDWGWTVSGTVADGPWVRAIPSAGGTRGDPPADYDGSGRCYVTDNATYGDIDGGTTILTSPVFDVSLGAARISYARWYSNDRGSNPLSDVMRVFVMNGVDEALVETVGPISQASGGWYVHNFLVQDFLTPTATMRVRFEASDLGEPSLVEAAVDAFNATAYRCGLPLAIVTETLAAADLGQPYTQQLEAENGYGQKIWTDKHDNLAGTGLSLSSDGLISGKPERSGTISFTAVVTDNSGDPDERLFEIEVATCCVLRVGDVNGEGGDEPTISDIGTLIDVLFITGSLDVIPCLYEADLNQSGGADVVRDDLTISDVATLIDYLFITGSSLGLNDCL